MSREAETRGSDVASSGSKTVVYAALAANLGIALAKFAGAALTGSAAMLAEGVHSVVDTGNQALLLFGMKRSQRPADEDHPFGYAREIYFWSFIVAVLLFAVGGTVAIYEGVEKLRAPHPIDNPLVNFVILGIAILLESGSFVVALKEFRAVSGNGSWWRTIVDAKDPVLFTVLFEDSAAIAGLLIALVGLIGATLLDAPRLDGAASILIGFVLIAASWLLARETKGLIIGEAARPEIVDYARELIANDPQVTGLRTVRTLHLGPHDILVTARIDFDDSMTAAEVETKTSELSNRLCGRYPDVKRVYFAATSVEPEV